MIDFSKFRRAPEQIGQKAKMAGQMFKIQKELAGVTTEYEEKGIKVVIKGGGLINAPKIKELEFEGEVEDKDIVEIINKALKESHQKSLKKLKEVSGDLQGMAGV
ncbi:hypothetical protein COT66_01955 [Candidatus Shapirobacteria bacterium CG09_land_8_20_14_0_10_49_15]|uniref:Nucleoid-associated protein n=2 Tax=Candidatus Shapironibacteriota TaxID=1752721 RepID=A0A2M8L7W7_9BACT|nr:MAG: hypothetical protein COT66_01955 [Candidatus Shapirobacteria bacterium CG09_land_8_20_14_0_10_49_15]PJE70329.1 MAG: hypothetical protein COU97_00240 [Candidatus Shapirobacteria bacterium CG10_big_fil_rev_8_21_14_0_10_48_15]